MPHAADGHTLILADQLADFYRPIGGDPARGVVRLADGNRLRINLHTGRLQGEITAGQAPGGHPQRGVILPDDQQQLIGRVAGILNDPQQRLVGLRQRQAAHPIAGVADDNAVLLGQAIAQRVKGDTAIIGLNTQPRRHQRRSAKDVRRRFLRISDGDIRRRHLHTVEKWPREVA